MTYVQKGVITGFPSLTAYHNPDCLVNIISLDFLQSAYHTTFNSEERNAFTVHLDDERTIIFEGFGSGLYFHNLKSSVIAYPYTLLNTVSENKTFFSRREIEGAEKAREQQGQFCWPSDQEYYEIIRDNRIKNSKVTLDDLRRAEYIFGGPAVNLLKGKTFYTPVNPNRPVERIPLPPHILKTHPTDNLDIDFMYCQGAPYLLMKTAVVKFRAIQSFNRVSRIIQRSNSRRITYKRGPMDIINGIEKVLGLLRARGFTVSIINADNEFQKLENRVSAHLEICATRQHIHRIERDVRSVKDRTRCFWVPLPFKKAPKLMVDECLIMVISCLNDFPSKNGISQTLSPASIVLGRDQMNGKHLKATFGRYYEVYCGTDNTNRERRTSAICLRPSNSQGGYYFLSLETGKKIHGYKFTELAMPNNVIDRIHELGENEGAEDLDDDGCPIFEWELGTPVRELEDDENLDDSHDGDTVDGDTGHDDNDDENTDDNNDSVVDGNISDED